ncbi:hypothetical protein ACHAXS_006859 [Conticribra weissflogii]
MRRYSSKVVLRITKMTHKNVRRTERALDLKRYLRQQYRRSYRIPISQIPLVNFRQLTLMQHPPSPPRLGMFSTFSPGNLDRLRQKPGIILKLLFQYPLLLQYPPIIGRHRILRHSDTRPIHISVQSHQRLEVTLIRVHVVLRPLRIIHAVAQVPIMKILIRMPQSQPVPQLVTHRILLLRVGRPLQVIIVHLGQRSDNVLVLQQNLIDAPPIRRAVISIAHLHRPPNRPTLRIVVPSLSNVEGDRIGVAIVPIRNGRFEKLVPVTFRVQVVEHLEGQSAVFAAHIPHVVFPDGAEVGVRVGPAGEPGGGIEGFVFGFGTEYHEEDEEGEGGDDGGEEEAEGVVAQFGLAEGRLGWRWRWGRGLGVGSMAGRVSCRRRIEESIGTVGVEGVQRV